MRTHEGNSEPIPLQVGDRVHASVTGFLDPDKSWAVGMLCEIVTVEDGRKFYRVGPSGGKGKGKPWPNCPLFEHASRVSPSSARRIIRALRRARREPLFDQIWRCLIEAHREKKS